MESPYQGDLRGKTHQETFDRDDDDRWSLTEDYSNNLTTAMMLMIMIMMLTMVMIMMMMATMMTMTMLMMMMTFQGNQTLALHRSHNALPQVLCREDEEDVES